MDKYAELRTHETDGANYGISTADVIARLKVWEEKYGIDISDVDHSSVTVHFRNLPDDLDSLANEIYEFCPDTIDQHFGLFDEVVAEEVPDSLRELVDGVDFEDENFGFELLKKSLQIERMVALWWD